MEKHFDDAQIEKEFWRIVGKDKIFQAGELIPPSPPHLITFFPGVSIPRNEFLFPTSSEPANCFQTWEGRKERMDG